MRCIKSIFLLLLSFASLTLSVADEKIRWVEISTDFNEELLFVSGNSKDNFWVQTFSGTLFNIRKGKINTYPPPNKNRLMKIEYFQISGNDFFCSATTSDWKGEIYRVKNNTWSKYKFENPYPIRSIYETSDNNYYIIGDFGTLLKYSNNDWEIIPTPFESHIISAITDKNLFYFATRGDGVILYDGFSFKNLSSVNNKDYIYSFKIIDQVLYGFSVRNKLYCYKNNIEKKLDDNEIRSFFLGNDKNSNFGFSDRNIYVNNKKVSIRFPQSYNVKTINALDDGSFILLSNNEKFFISEASSNNSFINLAPTYRIDDLPNSYNIGTSFFDANNDGISDLLIINRTYGNYLSLFRGVKNSAFANITSITNLPFKESPISFYTITDVDKDNLSDIILQTRIDSLQKLCIYINLGEFKFTKTDEIILPNDFQTLGIRNLSAYDYDKDGDDDIIVTSYYGYGDKPGYVVIYKNNYWGNFSEVDTTFKSKTTRWNEKYIFADINNNDTLDIFNSTSWTNDHLFFGTEHGYVDTSIANFPIQEKTETVDALLSDYDNDGDLDVFTVGRNDFIRVYSNNGEGYFSEITSELFDKKFLNKPNIRYSSNLNIGDFNNDSFIDVLVTLSMVDTNYTTLFLNRNGKQFAEIPIYFGQIESPILGSTISDFDNDGDLDIYAATKSHNIFWVNTLDQNNSIEIKLNGVKSSTLALGSKIWLYEKKHLNDNNYLIGYKELGTEAISKNRTNDLTLHFGLDSTKQCDIKVRFPSGKEVVKQNVKAGSFIVIDEYQPLLAFLYRIPGNTFRFLQNEENQIYLLVIIISHVFLLFGLWYGFYKLHWTPKLTLVFAMLNIPLFWMSLYFASFSLVTFTKFLVPLLLTFLVTIIPLVLFTWINKSTKKDISGYNEKLLKLVMSFSHGEWALRNLNSILLLCENSPSNWRTNKDFNSKLEVRFKTFTEMTRISIKELIELEQLLGNQNENFYLLEKSLDSATKQIEQFKSAISLQQIIDDFTIIRTNIKEFRDDIYLRFSSNPTEVINNMITNFEPILSENKITVKKTKKYPNKIPVLIKSYELGDILDNLFQNSIKFMQNSNKKNISIELYKESPKIIIKFSNSGSIIPKEKWNIIFEQGYSEGSSTGQGLFVAREKLKKYGGRIYVDTSVSDKTTFKIELNESTIS